MTPDSTPSAALLRHTCDALGLSEGDLASAGETAAEAGVASDRWLVTGEWLTLAKRMGAEKVFFVGDDPVIVMSALASDATIDDQITAYRAAWCLARPQCLFLATEGEIRVYGLGSSPPASADEWSEITPLSIARSAGEVAARLEQFQRARVESGDAFDEAAFASRDRRADRQLLADVSAAAERLVQAGLPRDLAHLLIERVLLVRYLEDRKVVTREYFRKVAVTDERWERVLERAPVEVVANRPETGFERVLTDRSLTQASFRQLAADFNGDLFVVTPREEAAVSEHHLQLVRDMLLGVHDPAVPPMFLWAYNFDIVPTSLVSTMYEQFFHAAEPSDDAGTHYTPPELVQFVVNEVLTPEVLTRGPRVLDPACGSGTFLVEAFHAIVRFEMVRRGRSLKPPELRTLLLERLAGIDRNREAVRLAAFSLYLAFLGYQEPKDILAAGRLPRLIVDRRTSGEWPVLHVGDAFDLTAGEARDQDALERATVGLPWERQTFDVVIGNPPWDEPHRESDSPVDRWVATMHHPVGDRSPSQAFLWRSLSMLRPGGAAALLVGGGVLANARSDRFREAFLAAASLRAVVNFSDTRRLFFSKGSSPFLLIHFTAGSESGHGWFRYLTMRRSASFRHTHSMYLGRMDRRLVRQKDVRRRSYLWKTYAWGSHQDAALLSYLECEVSLAGVLRRLGAQAALGWQKPHRGQRELTVPTYIASVPEMRLTGLDEWGPIQPGALGPPPSTVGRPTKAELYSGQRIIVTRGVTARGPIMRLESEPYSFRHSAYGIPLQAASSWQAKVIFATMTSALGRYCLFMRAGRWGAWHDEVTKGQLLAIPIRLRSQDDSATAHVVSAVEALNVMARGTREVLQVADEDTRFRAAQVDLDDAVFELFGLTQAQRDLVNDLHMRIRDLTSAQSHPTTMGVRTVGTIRDLEQITHPQGSLDLYLETFIRAWNLELAPAGELWWSVHRSERPAVLCVVFKSVAIGDGRPVAQAHGNDEWQDVLRGLERALNRPVGQELFVEGIVRAVTASNIVVAKRDERRLWTSSAAREDIEATMLRVIEIQRVS